MVTELLEKGCVVVSLAGRDKGRLMAVLRVQSDGVWIADGKERPIQHPKRKNPRHVAACFTVGEASMATNRELRRALSQLKELQGQCLPV